MEQPKSQEEALKLDAAAHRIGDRLSAGEEEEGLHIGDFIAIAWDYKWVIIVFTAVAAAIGNFRSIIPSPIYQADALLQVEKSSRNPAIFSDVQPVMETGSSVSAELEIMRSRKVLGKVVDQMKLEVKAYPLYYPNIGAFVARRYHGEGVAQPWFNLPEYAWGGERIQLESFEVPDRLLNAAFTLEAGEAGRFELIDSTDGKRLQGEVGVRLEREYAGGDRLLMFVSYLKARPGTRFSVRRIERNHAVAELRGRLAVSERARFSGMVEARLTGDEPASTAMILKEIINGYVRQNVERRSAEAEKTLEFLEGQLPSLKDRLEAAEDAYNNYRIEHGTLDLAHETQVVLNSVVSLENTIMELELKRQEERQNFMPAHPRIEALDERIKRLKLKSQGRENDIERLPLEQQKILRLQRDVEVNRSLYSELLNFAQELRVAKAGTVGNVRIVDYPIQQNSPVGPNRRRTVFLWTSGGLTLSILLIWVLLRMRNRIEEPEVIERELGLPVYASIPHSKRQAKLDKVRKAAPGRPAILAFDFPNDETVEGFRSLRTGVQIALMDARNNVLLITGSSQNVGKSFVTKNYAAVLVQAGHRVVMVDADLRKGHLHRELKLGRASGVVEYVRGEMNLEDVIKKTEFNGLDLVVTGPRPPNPSELLMHQNFSNLIGELSENYDYVIVDAPPVLAVTDAIDIARLVGTTILVARAGRHPMSELEQTVNTLNKGGILPRGFIFNAVDTSRGKYRYGYKYGYGRYTYRYEYK